MGVNVKIVYEEKKLSVNPDPAKVGGEDDHHRIRWINKADYAVEVDFDSSTEWHEMFGGSYPTAGKISIAGSGSDPLARESEIYSIKTSKEGREDTTIYYEVTLKDNGGNAIASQTFSIKSKD